MTPELQQEARDALEQQMAALRPKLHRYSARMTGSVIDGEDVVQEALLKALEALPQTKGPTHLEGWLLRITHNAAMDFLRRRMRQEATRGDEDPDMTIDPSDPTRDRQVTLASLRSFMQLPVAQRSSVILMDVLGYSLEEIGDVIDASVPAVKAALHRGRTRLRDLARQPDDSPSAVLSESEKARLRAYADRFNARDFDAVRDMLAEEVRLELVARTRMNGKREVSTYLGNYGRTDDWLLVPGLIEGRPAVLVHDPRDPSGKPIYFVLLHWSGDDVLGIRDFRYARYVMADAQFAIDQPRS
jgi:RNA polymerase sigma-70 factor (ECF subfamily)